MLLLQLTCDQYVAASVILQGAVIQGTLLGLEYMDSGGVIINTASTGGKLLSAIINKVTST